MIARRAAKELANGEIVNLGDGVGVEVLLQAENGSGHRCY
jgi:Acyl CoA:acetate/3-ketoacid CoA transferase, beta subunit